MAVEVDAQAIWCALHKNVLSLDPGRVFPLASVRLFDHAIRDERIKRACGYNPITGALADEEKLTEVIKVHSPLCCFLGPAIFTKVLKESTHGAFEQAQRAMIAVDRTAADFTRRNQNN